MAECIYKRFTTDTVDFIADYWVLRKQQLLTQDREVVLDELRQALAERIGATDFRLALADSSPNDLQQPFGRFGSKDARQRRLRGFSRLKQL